MCLLKVAGGAFSGCGNGSASLPVGWSVGPPLAQQNISTATGLIYTTFCVDIHIPQTMNPTDLY